MNSKPSLRLSINALLLAVMAICLPAKGQAIADMNAEAMAFMKDEKWAEAYAVLAKATNTYDGRALQIFGPRFGWFWYFRGYSEVKLGMFNDAMNSFKVCYEKYANVPPKEGQAPSINMYEKKALLMWGHAANGAEEWATSIRMYKKFLEERDPTRDDYNKGVFFINMAVNNYKLGKIPDGNENLETAIKGKVLFPTPNKAIMSAFSVMVAAVIEKKDEKALLDFIQKNRAHIKLEPFEAYEYSPLFMKLALDARGAEMDRSCFELYALVPSTIATIDDIKARLSTLSTYDRRITDGAMSVRKGDLEESLKNLEAANTSGKVNEIYAYLNTAVLHEEEGNVRGAFAVYEQLELYFPKATIVRTDKEGKVEEEKLRENNLFQLVRTASIIGEVLTTEKYGSLFLKDFPDSKHVDSVRRMMLTSLFFNGEYAKCIEVAERMIDTLTKPSEQHDICLFVLGGSKHYLGEFFEAQPLLDQYISTYKNDKGDKTRIQAGSYFQAANLSRLQEWTRSASLLDRFFSEYPDPKTNPYFPFALYDRANCHYAENELDEALEKVTRIETEFSGVSVMESNLALKGNILEGLSRTEEAEQYYLKALELAQAKKNDLVASECLFYLVAVIGPEKIGNEENPRVAESVPYYNQFWEKYSDSPFKAKVAVAGIPGMAKIGKMDEALTRLQGVITQITKVPGTPGLEEAIGSYTDAYLIDHTPEELKDHYYDFKNVDSRDMATRALLRIAIIEVFERELKKADQEKDESKVRGAKAMIDILFEQLRNDFQPKDLTNFILVRVGDFIRKNTSQPFAAEAYYQEALNRRDDQSHMFPAIFGLADIYAKGSSEQKNKAIELLKRVSADSEEISEKDNALFLTAQIHFDNKNYDAAIETTRAYLAESRFRQHTLPSRMIYAESQDRAGRTEDAILVYGQIWVSSPGAIRYSAPAMKRFMELLWQRNTTQNGVSDRQLAYERGDAYIKQTTLAVKKATSEERAVWEQVSELVKTYEAHSDTTPIVEDKKK